MFYSFFEIGFVKFTKKPSALQGRLSDKTNFLLVKM